MIKTLSNLLSGTEALLYLFVGAILVAVCNIPFFLTFFGLGVEKQYVSADLSMILHRFLASVDHLSFSPAISFLLFWSIIGLVVLSIINTIIGTATTLSLDVQISKRFFHPSQFSQRIFWKTVIVGFASELLGILVLIASGILLIVATLPFAIICSQIFITHPLNILNAGYIASGLVAVWLNILVCLVAGKLALRQYRLQRNPV